MANERLFSVEGSVAVPGAPITLADAGLRERRDLQEWVLAHPEIMGEGVLIVGFEFDRWQSGSSGDRERDRLDVLGIDTDGRLVLAELKRDKAPDTVHMQAVKYAAMASRFTEETLLELFIRSNAANNRELDEETARETLVAHAGDLDPEQLRRPRIVLIAGSFTPVVTATVVWLTEMGLDISMQRVQAYRVFDSKTVVTVSQLFPIVDVEEFTVSPQRAEARATRERRKAVREKSTVHKLVEAGVIEDGTPLFFRATNEVAAEVREALAEWVGDVPRRGRAIWFNRTRDPIEWEVDGNGYLPTTLVSRILADSGQVSRPTRGPAWWILPDGRALNDAAAELAPTGSRFDWSRLHEIMASIPPGRWTTYGDLAQLIGTAPQPLGQHITRCPDCENAHRVMGSDGRVRVNFSWSDPSDARDPVELLKSEGVVFADGVADSSQRMTAGDFLQL